MTTVIFVHGTSVREPDFSETLNQVKTEINKELPDVKVIGCSWGSSLGAKLNADGASIPLYDSTRKSDKDEIDVEIIRWMQLYQDPLHELKLLTLQVPEEEGFSIGNDDPSSQLDEKVRDFKPSEELKNKLKQGGISDVFSQAHQIIINSKAYEEALETISKSTVTEYRDAIARAIIAETIALCEEKKLSTIISTDASLRDEIVKLLSSELYKSDLGIGDWLQTQILKLAIGNRRGDFTDNTSPMVGDILLYQARGQKIRGFIEKYINEAKDDVVLLAHSLGGIACVDLLVEKPLEKVKLLVTVGSQAPYFYELNALQSLEFGKPLPKFPEWLNIYDLKDFLSYIGVNIFLKKVEDFEVDNKQPFPQSHGAYWTNKGMWKEIIGRIKAL